jgi:hypothetical protein
MWNKINLRSKIGRSYNLAGAEKLSATQKFQQIVKENESISGYNIIKRN